MLQPVDMMLITQNIRGFHVDNPVDILRIVRGKEARSALLR